MCCFVLAAHAKASVTDRGGRWVGGAEQSCGMKEGKSGVRR